MRRVLVCNIGNTNTHIANWVDDKIEKVVTLASSRLCPEKITLKKPDIIWTASTVPEIRDRWRRIVRDIWDMEVFSLSRNIDFGLELNYKGEIGQDRIANLAAGYLLSGSSFIVIDFGTATTIDVAVDARYRGGLIFAGLDLGLKALYRYTSLLPRVEFKKTDKIVGRSTDECILSGAYWGEVARIEGIVQKIREEFTQEIPLLTTGGMGEEISRALGARYDRWRTLRGIKYIADRSRG
ncbi:type III pantothenate kinase [candidate division WOR-3 bacterium]|nr:type III pantothenate kinase [candidate division WOR-3 bacterium]